MSRPVVSTSCLYSARFGVVALAVAALASSPCAAHAQTPSEADRLFDEAMTLVKAGNYAGACPKLEQSQTLDPGLGTQFNLADCYEHVGRTASAYRLFRQVAVAARAAGKGEREASSKGRADALEPKLVRVVVHAPPIDRLDVRVDGQPAETGGTPVDPGEHVVAASAPGRDPWQAKVTAASASVDVTVPELARTKAPPPVIVRVAPSRGGTQRTLGFIAGGIGVAGVVVGTVAGILAIQKHGDAKDKCPDPKACPDAASASLWNDATTFGNVSTVGFVVGGVGLAASAVLFLTAPRANDPARTTAWASPRISPWIGAGGGGAVVTGGLP